MQFKKKVIAMIIIAALVSTVIVAGVSFLFFQ